MATHRGVRSEVSAQRRYAKRTIVRTCRNDLRKAEQICMLTTDQVMSAVQTEFGSVLVEAVNFEKGEVISDSRGEGSFQRMPRDFLEWALAIGV